MACALAGTLASPAAAEVAVHLGLFDVTRSHQVLEGGFEIRRPVDVWGLELTTGLAGTADASVWVWAGLRRDFAIGERWLLAPGLGVALFEEGDGKDLGGPIQFRSGLEASYLIGRGVRVGVAYTHLSNAGLDDLNPGANSILVTLRMPP